MVGRGFRWMYYATGMPGWMRAWFGWPAFGNPFGFCRWFPWMPRWWWSGIYGPIKWTPEGPVIASIAPSEFQQMTKEQEIQFLEQELKVLEEDRKALEEEIESVRKRLEELRK